MDEQSSGQGCLYLGGLALHGSHRRWFLGSGEVPLLPLAELQSLHHLQAQKQTSVAALRPLFVQPPALRSMR